MVHGRSGNRAAVFPLEVNGIFVDPLNTCHFSAHSAYPRFNGQVLSTRQLDDTIDGLIANNIFQNYTHLLTGYLADASIAHQVYTIHKMMNNVTYICDPVLGDNGHFYSGRNFQTQLDVMKKELIPVADTVTPNSYEAMWLTGYESMNNPHELVEVVSSLHNLGPRNIIITSTEWSRRFTYFSWNKGEYQIAVETPSFSRSFDGPGDVFTALLLANMINFNDQYETISIRTVNSIYSVLEKTEELHERELAIYGSVNVMRDPVLRFGCISYEEFVNLQAEANDSSQV
ncbi:pyridoxal kinase [Histomonas meleagridis]|uniref:pyridoxal kinase n=1 Tax=Histomonas meleagridis TaxID=135588 RepID=UPI00355A7ECD|nr:pyridoxal kinase [Histomonas meleagridis]KAH0797266.1 pyridoxal kinase [Histomonas meleagridis]